MASVNPLDPYSAKGYRGLESLIAEVEKLVSLPDIYSRLEEEIVDPASTSDTVAELLHSDPDLCARMLRVANSAFYGFPTEIDTIERAVNVIGLRQIRELVLATSVVKVFDGIPPGMVDMSSFWEHSVAVGIMARALGRHARIATADSFYVPGLLHDIGRLVMYVKLPDLMHDLLNRRDSNGECMHILERQILDYTHAELGARLLESWKIPQSIWEPVATHHQPENGGKYVLAACAIHAADAWVNTNRAGSTGSCFILEMDREALQKIGVEIEDLHQIGLDAMEETAQIVRQFTNH